ncbi:penicillin-insensitive murein endopeptidase [Vibrio sp. 404]|uniref:Penicillin-insensitive murein endopeptidase n=1 Tax=Vibrio marinisediminis TaxID=2758441 RepID=A0A7W2ITL9_9VIBR|nr:penicillin-insensitive murein endopeptidase [Vibrio marinisediminis]MBA5762338.1 penicillin-insensitive murein endopeptidase [Vibrio marinisediminis]
MKMTWLAITLSLVSFSSLSSPWESFSQPNRLAPEAIGSYANGCLFGAKALPLKGYGYQVLRSQNQRYYAHPNTIAFVQRLSAQAQQDLRTHLLIGDMSLPQGGRFSSGHSSHQTGLDVDIWLRLADAKLSDAALKVPTPKSLVNMSAYTLIPSHWDSRHFGLMKMAAQDEEVARIFVHPLIKEKLCNLEGGDRAWLRKIRPWWGHNYHMHVRLHCPDGESSCVEQSPPPKGDGCGMEVASWRPKPDVKAYRAKAKDENRPVSIAKVKPKPKKILPQLCTQLVDQTR